MVRKGYTPEQIINKLREAEVMLSQGATIAVISKRIGVSDHTYYRWRKEYGGMTAASSSRSGAPFSGKRVCWTHSQAS